MDSVTIGKLWLEAGEIEARFTADRLRHHKIRELLRECGAVAPAPLVGMDAQAPDPPKPATALAVVQQLPAAPRAAQPDARPQTSLRADLLHLLAAGPLKSGELVAGLKAQGWDGKRKGFDTALRAMKIAGHVTQARGGDPYIITTAGLAIVQAPAAAA